MKRFARRSLFCWITILVSLSCMSLTADAAPELKSLNADTMVWHAKPDEMKQFVLTALSTDGTTRNVTSECKWWVIDDSFVRGSPPVFVPFAIPGHAKTA